MAEIHNTPQIPERLYTTAQVLQIVPYHRVSLWRKVRTGTFPAPVILGPGRLAWRESDIVTWQASLESGRLAPRTQADEARRAKRGAA